MRINYEYIHNNEFGTFINHVDKYLAIFDTLSLVDSFGNWTNPQKIGGGELTTSIDAPYSGFDKGLDVY